MGRLVRVTGARLVKYLLDTHVILWLYITPERLRPETLGRLALPSTTRLVSPISAYELAIKHRLGRLDEAAGLIANWTAAVTDMSCTLHPLSVRAAIRAGSWTWEHRDPWDRLLAAQAVEDDLTLITIDSALQGAPGVQTLW